MSSCVLRLPKFRLMSRGVVTQRSSALKVNGCGSRREFLESTVLTRLWKFLQLRSRFLSDIVSGYLLR